MCGKKGMLRTPPARSMRQQMWQTIRIKARGFTVPDLVVTVPGGKRDNAMKFITILSRHGYVVPVGPSGSGHPGQWQRFRLSRGHDLARYPGRCDRCGQLLSRACGPVEVDHGG